MVMVSFFQIPMQVSLSSVFLIQQFYFESEAVLSLAGLHRKRPESFDATVGWTGVFISNIINCSTSRTWCQSFKLELNSCLSIPPSNFWSQVRSGSVFVVGSKRSSDLLWTGCKISMADLKDSLSQVDKATISRYYA